MRNPVSSAAVFEGVKTRLGQRLVANHARKASTLTSLYCALTLKITILTLLKRYIFNNER